MISIKLISLLYIHIYILYNIYNFQIHNKLQNKKCSSETIGHVDCSMHTIPHWEILNYNIMHLK